MLRVELLLASGVRIAEHAGGPAYIRRALKRALQRAEVSIKVGPPTHAAHWYERHVYDAVVSICGVRIDLPGGHRLVGAVTDGSWRVALLSPSAPPQTVRAFAAPGVPPGPRTTYSRHAWLVTPSDSYAVRAHLLETLALLGAP